MKINALFFFRAPRCGHLLDIPHCRLYQRSRMIYYLSIENSYKRIQFDVIRFQRHRCFFVWRIWCFLFVLTKAVDEKKSEWNVRTNWKIRGCSLVWIWFNYYRTVGIVNKCLFSHNFNGCMNILNIHVCIRQYKIWKIPYSSHEVHMYNFVSVLSNTPAHVEWEKWSTSSN